PSYLAMRQIGPDTWDVFWKVPALGEDRRFRLDVELPSTCTASAGTAAFTSENAFTRRWTVRCPGPLTGKTISIAGLPATTTDVLVRIDRLDGSAQITRLTPAAPSFVVEAAPDRWGVARTYTVLGVEHILTGIDHLLFVLALIIITGGGWKLAKTVTAFTVSHSITLSLAALGYVHVPQRPVEACIALSIVFVATEILRGRKGHPGIAARAPWLVALTFGLMHGLGFASGLSEAGLPVAHIPTALLFFSAGVETGHFLFIGAVLALAAAGVRAVATVRNRRRAFAPPRWLPLVPPYAIGSIAMFWMIQRLAAF
ncbi:MAG TPA: HupE/UreJ family protein, partial [Thermoanaerobaculia bacterium]|nr:HupE/UreJ family protein [Thermoanaerobaculia bacterium]